MAGDEVEADMVCFGTAIVRSRGTRRSVGGLVGDMLGDERKVEDCRKGKKRERTTSKVFGGNVSQTVSWTCRWKVSSRGALARV